MSASAGQDGFERTAVLESINTPQDGKKEIQIKNPGNLPTIDYHRLQDFQKDLKIITPENLQKLKDSILERGFIVPKFVWIPDGNIESGEIFTIDGHQTTKALRSLEEEGWTIGRIPIVLIPAKSKKEAAENLLVINSSFGFFNPGTNFFERFELEKLEIKNKIEIPELFLDFSDFQNSMNQDSSLGNSGSESGEGYGKLASEVKIKCDGVSPGEVRIKIRELVFPLFQGKVDFAR